MRHYLALQVECLVSVCARAHKNSHTTQSAERARTHVGSTGEASLPPSHMLLSYSMPTRGHWPAPVVANNNRSIIGARCLRFGKEVRAVVLWQGGALNHVNRQDRYTAPNMWGRHRVRTLVRHSLHAAGFSVPLSRLYTQPVSGRSKSGKYVH